ncbi:replication associated protein [Lake Sarah-associated circular molecule 9]|uniref:replication associated protein n=1 Tax=Lake Sarah-associated circular molecule 9 TaxID=1685734 RepID=UPI000777F964|nr:replication associated protein [Lake Sarah-associated circular molecule 9]ALE29555.1 replication associated protein [Lake Sarah-associated circular molecule 9]
MSKGNRAWCYTLNNYTEEERDSLRSLKCAYQVFGYERGAADTPHLQGYVQFAHQKTLSAVKKLLPRAHLEERRGTIDQAVEYCKKDGDFEEYGKKPMSQKEKGKEEKNRWKRILEKADEGDEEWLRENEPNVAFKHMATFRSHKKPRVGTLQYEETPHEWWVGPTGTGKSRKAHEEYPNHYAKEKNKWWCGYTGQETVIIEEADPKTMEHLAARLKVWADRYPFPGEIKGGRIEGIRPLRVIVISNYTIEECFANQNDVEPLRRRFKEVKFGERTMPSPWHPSYTL